MTQPPLYPIYFVTISLCISLSNNTQWEPCAALEGQSHHTNQRTGHLPLHINVATGKSLSFCLELKQHGRLTKDLLPNWLILQTWAAKPLPNQSLGSNTRIRHPHLPDVSFPSLPMAGHHHTHGVNVGLHGQTGHDHWDHGHFASRTESVAIWSRGREEEASARGRPEFG